MLISVFHALPDFKGKRRLARMFLKKYLSGKETVLKIPGGMEVKIPNFIETVGFELLVNGSYEKETTSFILEKIPLNGVFFDIGANIGAISIPVCKNRPDIKSVSIEASPRVYSYLKHNVALNNIQNAILINKAVSQKEGETVNFYSPQELFGKGSLSAVFTDQAEEVQTVTICSLMEQYSIPKPDFIKIDIEGYEYFAFQGGESILTTHDAPDILFEFVDWAETATGHLKAGEAQELLLSYGYSLYVMRDGKLDKQPIREPLRTGSAMLYATRKLPS